MEPKLTIVYHVHNSYVNTKESIISLLTQTDKNFNVICILDNIDDGIKSILNEKKVVSSLLENNVSCIVVVIGFNIGGKLCYMLVGNVCYYKVAVYLREYL